MISLSLRVNFSDGVLAIISSTPTGICYGRNILLHL
jgi:hypothetical protein